MGKKEPKEAFKQPSKLTIVRETTPSSPSPEGLIRGRPPDQTRIILSPKRMLNINYTKKPFIHSYISIFLLLFNIKIHEMNNNIYMMHYHQPYDNNDRNEQLKM